MVTLLEEICESLDALALTIEKASSEKRTFLEAYGWNCPAVTRIELSNLSKNISDRIKQANVQQIDSNTEEILGGVADKASSIASATVPYFFNGNAVQAVPAYMGFIDWLNIALEPILGWQTISDNKSMPAPLARRLRSIQAGIDELIPEKEVLQAQIVLIQEATSAAESLPTDMQALKEARKKIDRFSTESAELFGTVDANAKKADQKVLEIDARFQEADKLVEQCGEAYRTTTSKGLAAAFDQRATSLNQSMWVWVLFLFIALAVGSYIGASRVTELSKAIGAPEPKWGIIWLQIVLSIFSIGAPLWFSWLATKQIGQRFRLAEDYAYKASISKAYEGYRREAARIDEAFEARLFSSALTRLEEAPLRLVEQETHGSPWHELFNSVGFQKAMDKVPEFKSEVLGFMKGSKTDKKPIAVEDE